MFRIVLTAFFCFVYTICLGQYKLTIRVKSLPAYHNFNDSIYLAGSFNNWNPADKRFVLDKINKGYQIDLVVPKGLHEFKLTKGSWKKVETGEKGSGISNRIISIDSDSSIEIAVIHWSDHFPNKEIPHTVSSNVIILDSALYMPQLDRYRRVWVYLPASYSSSRKKYPVLYMHDGQNVFDDATSYSGEWGVDEALDTLGAKYGETIIVAVDNGGIKRLNEYAPYDMERFGKGEGDQYVDFLVKTLRPVIEKKFRTKKCRKYNSIAGSSMGGLISLYAMLKYPKKFGAAGVFSPAFWIVPELEKQVPLKSKKLKGNIYFYAGMLEGETMVPDMLKVFELLDKHSKAKMISVIRAEGKHNEHTWRVEFPQFYKWLTSKQ